MTAKGTVSSFCKGMMVCWKQYRKCVQSRKCKEQEYLILTCQCAWVNYTVGILGQSDSLQLTPCQTDSLFMLLSCTSFPGLKLSHKQSLVSFPSLHWNKKLCVTYFWCVKGEHPSLCPFYHTFYPYIVRGGREVTRSPEHGFKVICEILVLQMFEYFQRAICRSSLEAE